MVVKEKEQKTLKHFRTVGKGLLASANKKAAHVGVEHANGINAGNHCT